MRVKTGECLGRDAPAAAEAADDLLFHDYYTRTPRLRLTADGSDQPTATEVMLDGNDVARLVECAIRHPSLNMRQAVWTAIWNHAESFRQIFRFGLQAPGTFSEIRNVVAEELEKCSGVARATPVNPAGETLLPRMPPPAHLRGRKGSR